ncbi:hypothetical protein D512_22074 [Burkholderia pseudomallei MSHR1043]|nr:hypothetical protein D512_22074 [Burkholderia pseudomallei MSHR1043]
MLKHDLRAAALDCPDIERIRPRWATRRAHTGPRR